MLSKEFISYYLPSPKREKQQFLLLTGTKMEISQARSDTKMDKFNYGYEPETYFIVLKICLGKFFFTYMLNYDITLTFGTKKYTLLLSPPFNFFFIVVLGNHTAHLLVDAKTF